MARFISLIYIVINIQIFIELDEKQFDKIINLIRNCHWESKKILDVFQFVQRSADDKYQDILNSQVTKKK